DSPATRLLNLFQSSLGPWNVAAIGDLGIETSGQCRRPRKTTVCCTRRSKRKKHIKPSQDALCRIPPSQMILKIRTNWQALLALTKQRVCPFPPQAYVKGYEYMVARTEASFP